MKNKFQKGFTLIELLIVMAILGVLAVVVLVAINPVQQLARTRDAGRKSAVTQIGHALAAYSTVHEGVYLTTTNCTALATGWLTCLVDSGELSTVPAIIDYGVGGISACTGAAGGEEENLCYAVNGPGTTSTVYARLESDSEISKCDTTLTDAYFVWSSADGRGGLVCTNGTEPASGTQNWNSKQ